jgi:hypothetical protein
LGYDITCRGPHPEVDALDARIRELYPVQLIEIPADTEGISITRIDVAEPLDGEDHSSEFDRLSELQRQENAYFRVGYFHMPELVRAMDSLDALDHTPHPPWPADASGFDDPALTAVRAFEGETPLIPKAKLTSNDHWIITAEQASASFIRCVGQLPEVMREDALFWAAWLSFLSHIASHDGAEVT